MRQETRTRKLTARLQRLRARSRPLPRAAGKTYDQACLAYAAALSLRLARPDTPPHEQRLIQQQLDKLRRAHPEWNEPSSEKPN